MPEVGDGYTVVSGAGSGGSGIGAIRLFKDGVDTGVVTPGHYTWGVAGSYFLRQFDALNLVNADSGTVVVAATPTPTPAPSFVVQPSITGTPTVGHVLSEYTYNDGTAINGTITTRTILLGGVAKLSSYVLVTGDIGASLQYQNIATGVGTPAVATSAGVTVVAGATTPSDPVTSNMTSGWTSGDNPPNWDTTYSGIYYDPSDFTGDGLRIRYKFAGAGSYTTLPWIPFDVAYLVDGFTYAFLTDGTLNAGGAFEVQVQAGRDFTAAIPGAGTPASTSGWSNTWSDTLNPVAETPSVFTNVNGVNKNASIGVPGSAPLRTVAGPGGGFNNFPVFARVLTASRTGKREWEIGLSTLDGNNFWVGFDDGTQDLTTGNVVPGKDNTKGVMMRFNIFDFSIWEGGIERQASIASPPSVANGDKLKVAFDDTGLKAKFIHIKAGVSTQLGVDQSFTALSAYRPVAGGENATTLTHKFDTGLTNPLSGYVPYDN